MLFYMITSTMVLVSKNVFNIELLKQICSITTVKVCNSKETYCVCPNGFCGIPQWETIGRHLSDLMIRLVFSFLFFGSIGAIVGEGG